jgi:hypothetical protein
MYGIKCSINGSGGASFNVNFVVFPVFLTLPLLTLPLLTLPLLTLPLLTLPLLTLPLTLPLLTLPLPLTPLLNMIEVADVVCIWLINIQLIILASIFYIVL